MRNVNFVNLLKEMDSWLQDVDLCSFTGTKTLCRLVDLVSYREVDDEGKAALEKALENHRASRGIMNYGVKTYYDTKNKSMEMVDVHYATMKVEAKNNRPHLTLTFNDNVVEVRVRGHLFKKPATGPIILIGSPAAMDDEFYQARVKFDDGHESEFDSPYVRVDADSIDTFYAFGGQKFVKFTKAIMDKYWRDPCTLTRYDVNKTSSSNDWGITYNVWRSNIVEIEGGVYIDDISNEEVKALTDGRSSWIAKEIIRSFRVKNNDDDEYKADVKKRVSDKLQHLQEIIDSHKEEILDRTFKHMYLDSTQFDSIVDNEERIQKKCEYLTLSEGKFGLDCGFIYFYFFDREEENQVKEASEFGLHCCYSDGTFSLNLPYENQSTTIKRIEANIIQDIIKNAGINICYKTVLD